MKHYYVEFESSKGKYRRTELYNKFEDAYNKYIEILEMYKNTNWCEVVYKTTRIITRYS